MSGFYKKKIKKGRFHLNIRKNLLIDNDTMIKWATSRGSKFCIPGAIQAKAGPLLQGCHRADASMECEVR